MLLPPELVRTLGYSIIAVTAALAVDGLIVGMMTGATSEGLQFASGCAGVVATIGWTLRTRRNG